QRRIYKPLALGASVDGGRMKLKLSDPGWMNRRTDDLVPDHGHLMHLYAIRLPQMERVWHLHPELSAPAEFTQPLPDMPAGEDALFGDVVHAGGLAETATGEMQITAAAGNAMTGDDAAGVGNPLDRADYSAKVAPAGPGLRMLWDRDAEPL